MPQPQATFVDIHCHLLPGIDDGARSWNETLAMARMAAEDGIGTVIATPHQLGNYRNNRAEAIRQSTARVNDRLREHRVPLEVFPGSDVRIEPELVSELRGGRIVTLADRCKHVLLELPHELYFQLHPLLRDLADVGVTGILSHPERNQGLLARPYLVPKLVGEGCLMQITAGSLLGNFGASSQQMAEWMLDRGLVHFVASDAHGPRSRRPLLHHAFRRVAELTDDDTAIDLFYRNPAAVVVGRQLVSRPLRMRDRFRGWFRRAIAG